MPDESAPLLLETSSFHAVSDRFGSHPWTECGAPDTSHPTLFFLRRFGAPRRRSKLQQPILTFQVRHPRR